MRFESDGLGLHAYFTDDHEQVCIVLWGHEGIYRVGLCEPGEVAKRGPEYSQEISERDVRDCKSSPHPALRIACKQVLDGGVGIIVCDAYKVRKYLTSICPAMRTWLVQPEPEREQ